MNFKNFSFWKLLAYCVVIWGILLTLLFVFARTVGREDYEIFYDNFPLEINEYSNVSNFLPCNPPRQQACITTNLGDILTFEGNFKNEHNMRLEYVVNKNTAKSSVINWKISNEKMQKSIHAIRNYLKKKHGDDNEYESPTFDLYQNFFNSKESTERFVGTDLVVVLLELLLLGVLLYVLVDLVVVGLAELELDLEVVELLVVVGLVVVAVRLRL